MADEKYADGLHKVAMDHAKVVKNMQGAKLNEQQAEVIVNILGKMVTRVEFVEFWKHVRAEFKEVGEHTDALHEKAMSGIEGVKAEVSAAHKSADEAKQSVGIVQKEISAVKDAVSQLRIDMVKMQLHTVYLVVGGAGIGLAGFIMGTLIAMVFL